MHIFGAMLKRLFIFLPFLLLIIGPAKGQSTIFVEYADSLKGTPLQRILIGHVVLHQDDVVMYCNRALFETNTNIIRASGKVKIIQADTVVITGDSGVYNGNLKKAYMLGRVQLDDNTILLRTQQLDYDMKTQFATYHRNATITNEESVLRSVEGIYNTTTKDFLFKKEVEVTDQNEGELKADSLRYNTETKIARFICPTTITTRTDTVMTRSGTYHTQTKASYFSSRTTAKLPDFELTGDTLQYDSDKKIGKATGNVVFYSKKDDVFLYGDHGNYDGDSGESIVYKNAWMKSILDADSLLLKADTLVSIENKLDSSRTLFAYHHVLIFKSDFSGKCDSLSYQDSLINFYTKPILWTQDSQILADTIHLTMVEKQLNKMDLRGHAFVISKDSLLQANQVKGRKMWVYFGEDNALSKVDVDGNGESIYYVVDDKEKTTGLNRVEAGKMKLFFKDNNVSNITFITRPEGKFIPPEEWTEDIQELDGFNWRDREKPTKDMIEPQTEKINTETIEIVEK